MPRTPPTRRWTGWLLGPALGAGLLALIWSTPHTASSVAATRIISTTPTIEEVRQIARLAVLRVQVANVLEGHNRGARALVLVYGDADIGLDLDRVEIAHADPVNRLTTLRIPAPQPQRPRVDHLRTRVYEMEKTGLAAWNPFADPCEALLDDCMRAAQEYVGEAVGAPGYIAQARAHAEELLRTFYAGLGWRIEIQWI